MRLLVCLYSRNLSLDYLTLRGNLYLKITLFTINLLVSIYISWCFRTYLIENISIEIPNALVNLVHGFSCISIFSVTYIFGEYFTGYNGISLMMPFGGGNSTGSNTTGGNSTSIGGNSTGGNPASNNQLVHQGGNQRRNRRTNPVLNLDENYRINRRPRRRGNLLVTRGVNPILNQENQLSRITEITTRNRNRNNDLHAALREHRYVGDFFQGRYVIRTAITWENPGTEDYLMGRNPQGVSPNYWGEPPDQWGRVRIYDGHNQALRGYILQGQNQPRLRNTSLALTDYAFRTNRHIIREDMFTKEELNYLLDFLEDKRPDLYHQIMDNPMPSGKPRWSRLRITSDLCTSLREA